MELVLEDQEYIYDPDQSSPKKFNISHRVFTLMNHRIVLVEKTTPETGEKTLNAEIYRQRINQKAKKVFSSYRIPLFFKWVVLNPMRFYEMISDDIEQWKSNEHETREEQSGKKALYSTQCSRKKSWGNPGIWKTIYFWNQ